jgi:hypothetical protein
MCESEDAQFKGMVEFTKRHGLAKYLQHEDWVSFAKSYNGPDFQKNKYDSKLARANARFRVGPLPNLRVRAGQLYLSFLGHNVGGVDGWFGEKTQKAVIKFQNSKGLPPTGMLDDATLAALQTATLG